MNKSKHNMDYCDGSSEAHLRIKMKRSQIIALNELAEKSNMSLTKYVNNLFKSHLTTVSEKVSKENNTNGEKYFN